ncbi:hypothetical protein CTEN210_11462 [Chaetoceros tenuissimus]|uniref:Uncharacterized protein n=1 Tax=Chaetoceros tenuissimus TaxID=426638 RepID=A0AAD3CZF6_9STRA|nr:hypothetical protein CTEN210_11462 [Chaetoceros tenuissimus]
MLQVTPEIGSRVEICDPDGIWSSAVVIKKSQEKEENVQVTIKYDGWAHKWDEKLDMTSERLSKIYTHTARVKCLAILDFRKKKSNGKKLKIHFQLMEDGQERNLRIQNHQDAWPCILHTRVPRVESRYRESKAVKNLTDEINAFVQPYRPDLLPVSLQNDWENGGFWRPTNCIKFFPFDPVTKKTLLDSGEFVEKQFRPGFRKALIASIEDKSTPGHFKHDWDPLYERRTLLREEYFPVEPPEGSDEINNPLVDFTDWRDELVLLSSLETIIPQSPVSKKPASKKGAKKKEAKSKVAKKSSESVDETSYNNGLSVEDAIELAKANSLVDDLASVQSYHQITGTRTSARNKSRSNSRSTTPIPGDSKMPALPIVPKRPVLPTAPGDSALKTPRKIMDSIYPGEDIIQCQVDKNWLAAIDVRGNKVMLGSYETQSSAKDAIDEYRNQNNKIARKSREEKSQKKLDDSKLNEPIVIDSSDDEEDIRISKIRVSRKRSRNESSGEYGDSTTAAETDEMSSKDSRDRDIEAVSVEKAVALTFHLNRKPREDTGFSIHNWAMVSVKEEEKKTWQKKFDEIKKEKSGKTT